MKAMFKADIGSMCRDGFVCRLMCTTVCTRESVLSASGAIRRPIMSDTKECRFNGMVEVVWKVIQYRGFTIQPKLDMGSFPHRSNSNTYKTMWVITKNGLNIMPKAVSATTPLAAKAMIDLWIEAKEDAEQFWKLVEVFSAN